MTIEKLKDFNKIIQSYKVMLSFTKRSATMKHNIMYCIAEVAKNLKAFNIDTVEFGRMLINYCSLYISQVHEKTKDADAEFLEKIFEGEDCIDNFNSVDREKSLKDKKREIRNALSHADFDIVIENKDDNSNEQTPTFNDICLFINNENIQGRITLEQLIRLTRKYKYAYYQMHCGDDVRIMFKPTRITGQSFDETLDNTGVIIVKRRKDANGMAYDEFRENFENCSKKLSGDDNVNVQGLAEKLRSGYKSFDIEVLQLNEREKDFLKQYYRYLGQDLLSLNMEQAFNQMLESWNEGILSLELLDNMLGTFNSFIRMIETVKSSGPKSSYNEQELEMYEELFDRATLCMLQAPVLYSNNLLAMAYYELDYVRELNTKSGGKIFDYHNIQNLQGISATVIDKDGKKEVVPIEESYLEKLNNKLQNVDNQLRKITKEKSLKEKQRKALENPQNKDPQKAKKLSQIQEFMEEYEQKKAELEEQRGVFVAQIDKEKQNGGNKKSSFEFFRHLRNSLAHGNYTITYGDFSNLESVTYIFNDFDEKEDYTYSVELTASQLEKILEGFQDKVNNCNKSFIGQKNATLVTMRKAICERGIGFLETTGVKLPRILANGENEKGEKGENEDGDIGFGDE